MLSSWLSVSLGSFSATKLNAGSATVSSIDLEPINGTMNYRLYGKKGKDDKPWFDGLDSRHIQCVRRGRCLEVNGTHNTCFGSKLPYALTSLSLTDYRKEKELNEALGNYYALRHVPKCWAVIQVR